MKNLQTIKEPEENGQLVKKEEPSVIIDKIDVFNDVKDPLAFPWPYEDGSIKELTCAAVFEFIPGKLRGRFMDEIYRILAPDGKAAFAVPYWNTAMGVHDYRYEFPTLTEQSFLLFNKEWRKVNKPGLELDSDFDFTYGYKLNPETEARSEETRSFNTKYYNNCVESLHLMLTKRAPSK